MRNPDIHAAQTFLEKFESWTSEVASELRKLMAIEPDFSKKVDFRETNCPLTDTTLQHLLHALFFF
eukprot:6257714-Amphidinium_carterae.1